MIEASSLAKSYQLADGSAVDALRGVSLSIRQGEIYALLGPNGAGKTTLLAILSTLLLPTNGAASIAGYDVATHPEEVRRRIGVTFQEVILDQELTGRQVLDFHGKLYGLGSDLRRRQIESLAARVELSAVLDRRSSTYSGGMKRRLELARGLMTMPQVLFLDEPTQGLDPQNRANIWTYVQKLRQELGLTILLTTHYMEEAEFLADRVGIVDHGKLIAEGEPAELARSLGADVVTLTASGPGATFQENAERLPYVSHVTRHLETDAETNGASNTGSDGSVTLQIGVDHGDRRLAELVSLAASSDLRIHSISVSRPTLADVFFAHTGRGLRDGE